MKIYFATALVLLFIGGNVNIKGRWESVSSTGVITGVNFKEDNSFEGYVNNKPFTSGFYTLKGDTIDFVDNGCDGKHGVYKINFYHNGDSMRWTPINDSCEQRKAGISRLLLGRPKK